MLVSVVIPTYNRAILLKRAILSVVKQTWKEWELIVVDDGSTDNTKEVVSRIRDPRIRYIYQDNRGVSAARNKGIMLSQGKLIALLDSDDVWKPTKLEKHLCFHLEGSWEISQTEEIWIRKGKRINPARKHLKKAGWIFQPSLKLCLISPSCVMFSKDLWEKIGPFDEELPACEDYDLWLRTSLKYPVGLLPLPLVEKHGGREDQLSLKIIGLDLYRIYALIKIYNQGLDREKGRWVKKELVLKASTYIKGCLKRGKWEEAERIKDMVENIISLRRISS